LFTILRSLRRHRRLIRDFVVRDLRARYVGSTMGFFWSVVFPIVNLFVFMFVFRLLLKTRWEDGASEKATALIMLCGILVWASFAETLARATNCLVENANLIQKVVFPAEVLPPFLVISSLANMMIGMPIVVLGCFVFTDAHIGVSIVWVPVLLLLQGIFTVGLGYLLCTLNLYLRDTYHVIGVVTTVWMFATPIFYPPSLVQNSQVVIGNDRYVLLKDPVMSFAWLLEINPMHWLIQNWRLIVVDGLPPDRGLLVRFAIVAFTIFAVGATFFNSQSKRIPDLL